jgi:drug/metabolite transporter (DMT)-like permease
MNISAVLVAIGSAVLFGLSAPVAKILLDTSDPWMLAGILYGGAGIGLLAVHLAIRGSAPWPRRV